MMDTTQQIYRDWIYNKQRHQPGGIDNSFKKSKKPQQEIVDYFNEKWGGNYCQLTQGKDGIYSYRRSYAKFLKDYPEYEY